METQAGSRYFLTCLDDKTRKIHVSFLRHKSEALDKLKDYLALVQNQLGTTAKIIKSDGGGEFTSTAFKEFCTTRGIQHIIVPPGAHAQNGRVERVHLTLANGMRTLLVDSGSPSTFWAEAINFMVHVKNRSPHFGSTAFYRLHTEANKLKPRSQKAVLVGFVEGTSTYRLWDAERRVFVHSRDVVFSTEKSVSRSSARNSSTPRRYDQRCGSTLCAASSARGDQDQVEEAESEDEQHDIENRVPADEPDNILQQFPEPVLPPRSPSPDPLLLERAPRPPPSPSPEPVDRRSTRTRYKAGDQSWAVDAPRQEYDPNQPGTYANAVINPVQVPLNAVRNSLGMSEDVP